MYTFIPIREGMGKRKIGVIDHDSLIRFNLNNVSLEHFVRESRRYDWEVSVVGHKCQYVQNRATEVCWERR